MFKRSNYSRYQNKGKRRAYAKGKYPVQKGRVASRYSLINTVQQVLRRNSELKYFDTAFSYSFTTTGTGTQNITVIPQGTTDTTRIGDRLKITSVEFRYNIFDASTAISIYSKQTVRLVLVHWFPATTPGYSDVLTTSTTRALYNHDQRQMYKICWDKTISVIGGTSSDMKTGHIMYYPKKNTSVQFQNAGTTGTNRFFLFIVADGVDPANTSSAVLMSRVRFTDS